VSLEVELPTETYTLAEVSRALRDLSAKDKTLLVKIARAYAWKTSYGHEDLIQEALTRVLEGKRAWPRKLPVAVFLRGVMRSIASDWPPERHDDAVQVDGREAPGVIHARFRLGESEELVGEMTRAHGRDVHAIAQYRDAIAEALYLFHLVGDVDDRYATLLQFLQDGKQRVDVLFR